MLTIIRSGFRFIFATAAILAAGSFASADIITIANLDPINLTAGTQSNYVTFSVYDASGPSVSMFGWSLGVSVVPLGGATGTVTIDVSSAAYPLNHIFSNPFQSPGPGVSPNAPSAGDTTFLSSNGDFNGVTVNSGPPGNQNLLNLKFNASAGASGNFEIRLVDAGGFQNTYWTDYDSAEDRPFYVNGSPVIGTGGASIGTISVSAVPEPSSLLLFGSVLGLSAWRVRRRLR